MRACVGDLPDDVAESARDQALTDGAEILVRRNGTAAVTALAWNPKGTLLAFAAEDGDGGLLEL